MLRPERVELSPEPGPEGASLPVAVQDVTFLGNTTDVAAVTAWNTPVAVRLGFRHPLAGRVARGDRLWIYWTPEAAQAFPRG
nr:TOBE domain-containing protein [Rubellimicrobium aerolatum]